jgi:hypothetical protein
MTPRIDEKEELLYSLCAVYGLDFEYSWGKYWVSVPVLVDVQSFDPIHVLIFTRKDLSELDLVDIEEMIIRVVLEHGM